MQPATQQKQTSDSAKPPRSKPKVRAAGAKPRTAQVTASLEPLATSDQWSKVAEILSEAVISAKKARELQRLAAEQLDAATYALDQAIEEIADLVPGLKAPEEPVPILARIEPAPREKRVAASLAA